MSFVEWMGCRRMKTLRKHSSAEAMSEIVVKATFAGESSWMDRIFAVLCATGSASAGLLFIQALA
jgi:hypothetical protein